MMKTDDYNDQSVTEEKLKDGAITTRKIADGSVTKDKLDSSIRQEINDSVTASNEATEKAKEATAKADQATENAKQATVAATAAKEAADTATQAATTATTASVQATEQAKAATTKAEEATAKANEAAQKADDSREQTEQTLGTMQGVISNITKEQKRVGIELEKKFDKESVVQESGEAEDKVMSQKVVSDKLSDLASVLNKSIKDSLKYETGSHNILDIYCNNITNIAIKIKFKEISKTGNYGIGIYNTAKNEFITSIDNIVGADITKASVGEVSADTNHLILQINVAENSSVTFTDGTIEVIKYPQDSNYVLCETNDSLRGFDKGDTQSDFNSKIIGAAASVFDLSTINSPNAGVIKLGDIYGVFKKGQKIGLRTSKLDLSLTGNVAMALYNGSSKNPDVAINRDKIEVEDTFLGEVSADTNHLILQINVAENSSVTFTDGMIEVIKYPQEVIELDEVSKQSNTLQSLVNAQNIFSESPHSLTEWIWAKDKDVVYIGLSYESFEKDTCLRKIGLKFYEGKDYSYNGKTFDFLIGHIDQRNWFLPDKRISSTCIKKKYGSDDMFYFEFDDVIIKSGQTLVLEFPFVLNDGKAHAAVGLSKDSYKENSKIFYTYSLKQSVTIDRVYGFSYLYFDAVSLDSVFSTKSQVTEIKTEISDINNYLSRSGVLIDKKTLERYRIQISNGVIQAKKIDYKKGLALGNSYTRHGKADNLWFAYRAMAASVDELQWHQLVGKKIGATFTAMGAVKIESECDPDRDLEAYFNSLGLSDEYDVIIVQLGENIREKDETRIYKTFFNLLKYMLGAFSKADIYLMLGEPYNYVSTQIINVASALGLTVIDCRGLLVNKSTVNYRLGDYVQNDTGGYDYISVEGVSSGHPSDLGQVIMANKVLDAFLCDNITNMTYDVKLNQTTGGTISSSFSPRVAGGVVSIKCEPESGYSIGSLQFSDSSINAIKKTNTYGEYYVFIMPDKDLEITPEWVIQAE